MTAPSIPAAPGLPAHPAASGWALTASQALCFIGYSAAFPTLLKTVFGRGDIALTWAFLGAGTGSVIRPVGGKLADRIGGARITAASFVMLAAGAGAALPLAGKKIFCSASWSCTLLLAKW